MPIERHSFRAVDPTVKLNLVAWSIVPQGDRELPRRIAAAQGPVVFPRILLLSPSAFGFELLGGSMTERHDVSRESVARKEASTRQLREQVLAQASLELNLDRLLLGRLFAGVARSLSSDTLGT